MCLVFDVAGEEVATMMQLSAGEALLGGGFALDLIEDALMSAFTCCVGDDFRVDLKTMLANTKLTFTYHSLITNAVCSISKGNRFVEVAGKIKNLWAKAQEI